MIAKGVTQMSNETASERGTFSLPATLKELKGLIEKENFAVYRTLRALRRDFPFIRSRGKVIYWGTEAKGRTSDEWGWTGTWKNFKAAVAEARSEGAEWISVANGWDGSRDFDFDDYEPWIADWSLDFDLPKEAK